MTELVKFVGEKVRYDWYQTEQFVVINVLKRNIDGGKLQVTCKDRTLTISLPDWTENLEFQLSHDVNTAANFKVTPSKVEIKLSKLVGIQWKNLEGEDPNLGKPIPVAAPEASSSNKAVQKQKNWDALVKDEELDEGDALQELFKKIYSEGNEETRKAMNKSFLESNGTVLSTNWNQVGADKVEAKPPEGLEFKKWD